MRPHIHVSADYNLMKIAGDYNISFFSHSDAHVIRVTVCSSLLAESNNTLCTVTLPHAMNKLHSN